MYFGATSFDNEMDYAVIRNGNGGLRFAESAAGQSKLKLSNSQITNMEQSVLSAVNCKMEAVNTEFSNATGNVVLLSGGDYRFVHCTLANYYIITPGRQNRPVLGLENHSGALKAVFDNCLIDGSFSEGNEPLMGELSIDNSGNAELSYRFNHCAVKTKSAGDAAFVNTQFIHRDNAPAYKSIGRADNFFSFDFRPDTAWVVIGKADPAVASQYPLDRSGVDRTASADGPDIGAYEYVPEKEKQ
jgi:hypothetical protein